jgi:hypothetical protein
VSRQIAKKFLHEAGLADTRKPQHGEQLTRGVGNRLIECVVQTPAFAFSADHRRIQTADAGDGSGYETDEAERCDRRCFSLEGQRLEVLDGDLIAN